MKRTLALLLALVMCLSLAACGGNSQTSSTESQGDSVKSTEETETVSKDEPEILHLNESVQVGDFELCIRDVRTAEKVSIGFVTGGKQFSPTNDYFVCVTYSLKNIGKSSLQANKGLFTLNYADGYKFSCDGNLYLHGSYRNLYEHGGTQEPFVELQVLGDEVYFLEAFDVPAQVVEDTESPLFLTLKATLFNVDETNINYNIRPIDKTQQQALYDQANELWEEQNYTQAVKRLDEVGNYKDAIELREKIFQEYCLRVGTYYNDTKEYINSVVDTLNTISGDELKESIVGEWYVSLEGEFPMTFNADGTITDPNGSYASWSVNDDVLTIDTVSGTQWTCSVKELSDRGLILLHKNEQFFEDGEFFKGLCKVH